MTISLKWTFTPEQLKAKLNGTFGKASRALSDQLYISMGRLREYIVARRLNAPKGFSPDQLHHKSGNLINSTFPSIEQSIDGSSLIGRVQVANTAPYGRIHEYGGTFTARRQNLIHPPHLATRKGGERVMTGSPYTITFPERSFLRSSLREQRDTIITALKTALSRSIK
jgi:hypothetical protein